MESIAALGILVPTVTPLILKVGIDPLHFGLVMILNLMIGLLTPPFGMNLFILNKITGIPSTRIARACLPFFIPLFAALIVITLFPPVVTFLPDLLLGSR
jgi:TRAP-type C4-dicarboxylate transport system permease large subunit